MKADLFWIPGPWRGRLAIVPRPRGGDWLGDEARAGRRAGIWHSLTPEKNAGVHCRQGIGRSGLVASGVLMSSGIKANEAMQIVSSARGISVPETPEQRRWIEELPSRVPAAKES